MPRYAAGPDACGIQLITCPYFEKKGSHAMTILVAYVARPEGQAALDKGIEIATRRNEALVVVNAGPGGKDDPGVVDGYEGERLAERLAKLPVPAEFKHFVRGKSTVDEIEALVNHLDVSVLVIGLRRRTAVGKLLLGSTAQEILMTVSCPVLCVKAA
jgi:nucleotide-binding universal stress UspA family protein